MENDDAMSRSGNRCSRLALCLLLLLQLSAAGAQAALTASLDRQRIHMGETARLTLRSDGDEDPGESDLEALREDFDILQRSSSISTSIVNGRSTRQRELVLEITPRRTGSLWIPSFEVGGERSTALNVEVLPEPDVAPGDEVVLFTAELDRDRVYVQGQLLLTLRVQQAVNLDSRSVTELDIPGAFVKTLGQNSFQRSIDGRPWLVHEIRYAIFPETSGELRIPPQTFSGRLGNTRRSLFDTRPAGRLLRRSTDELVVPVLPRPDTFSAPLWLPARSLQLEEQWSAPLDSLRVGDSVTRTVTITGVGLQGAQLPPLTMQTPDGLRAYPDQPVINDIDGDSGVTGVRSDSVALVAVQAGEYRLPAVSIAWWDTESDSLRQATLPARTLRVQPPAASVAAAGDPAALTAGTAAGDSGTTQPTASAPTPLWWPALTALCALGWLLTTALWWRARRPSTRTPAASEANLKAGAARKRLLVACHAGDARAAQLALRDWLRATGQRGTLHDWAATRGSSELLAAVDTLQRHLYRGSDSGDWDGRPLAAAIRALPAASPGHDATESALPPLYPA
jgi:hypothetical protein